MTTGAELFEAALAHHRAGHLDDAIAAYGAALSAQPDHPELLAHLGVALRERHGLDAAIGFLQRALAIAPATARAWNVLANTLRERGLMDDAIDGFRRAAALLPGFAEAHSNLGNTLLFLNRLDDAAAAYRVALALRPELAEPRVGLFSIALTLCDFATADQCYRPVVDLANDPQEQRGWRILGTLAYRHLFRRLPEPAYQAMSGRIDRFLAAQAAGALPALPRAARPRPERLKIGFMSTNFGNHAVGQVAVDLFGALDHGRFELHAISRWDRSAEPQDYHRRMRGAFDGFHEVGVQAPFEIARRIHALGIDILVDLHGYMDHASPEILACRAAPIQVFWLGHAGGLAVGACDYLIADDQTVPPGEEGRYRQRIARLPEIYHCASPHAIAGSPPTRAACGLPERGFVFCAFNNPEKIDRAAFAAWMRILDAVEGSVLWLSDPGNLASRCDYLRRAAAAAGIDPARLVFAGWSPDKQTHLARHAHAGLLLDTFTLNASTTALDALWAGCPVLTVRGHDFASRIAGTMLRAIGLDDLIADDLATYHAQAVRLARDPVALGGIAARLRANRATHPLFDVARFARHFAQALDTMWDIHMSGEEPRHFDVAKLEA